MSPRPLEEYLETLWISEESGEKRGHIKWVAEHLGKSAPNAIEMLKKLKKEGFVVYEIRQEIQLINKGRKIAKKVIRSHRLIEVLMKEALKKNIREETVCGMEHHIDEEFINALCIPLKHPRQCPNGNVNSRGKCCSSP